MKCPNFSHPALFRMILAVILCITTWLSIRYGAVDVTLNEIFSAFKHYFSGTELDSLNERIIITIRVPRALLCIFVGATLSVGGVLLQALFRNPIIEPGLIGTSSGAAFGAALYIRKRQPAFDGERLQRFPKSARFHRPPGHHPVGALDADDDAGKACQGVKSDRRGRSGHLYG